MLLISGLDCAHLHRFSEGNQSRGIIALAIAFSHCSAEKEK
jgi:hypothetical protein